MTSTPQSSRTATSPGIDRLLADTALLAELRQQRLGLLTNHACRTGAGVPTAQALHRALADGAAGGLACLFAPEHGYPTDGAAGAAIADARDRQTELPVYSLYGARRTPATAQLAGLDGLVVDLRDVGVRCYTYAATAALAAAAALDAGKQVFVCDRANPLGDGREGPPLDPELHSFLAYFSVPFVHGMTIGELLAAALRDHHNRDALRIVPALPSEAPVEQPWLAPSPALQSVAAVSLYPGLVLVEGTNLSEGRSTDLPFRCVAAPWLDAAAVADIANTWPTGIAAAACDVRPRDGPYAGMVLPAVRFDPVAPECNGFVLGVLLLAHIAATHPPFRWRTVAEAAGAPSPAAMPQDGFVIDALMGNRQLRETVERGGDAGSLIAAWRTQAVNTVSPSTIT